MVMRVSTGMIFDAGVNTINRQTSNLLHLQQEVSLGRRIVTPSDDPVGAARALVVQQSIDITAQWSTNHNNVKSALGNEEAQLTSVNDLMTRVRQLTVQAGNSTLTASDRRSITQELRARFDELVGIANADDGTGQYIFSGYMGSTKPFGGSVDQLIKNPLQDVVYQGDDGQRKLQASATRFIGVSDSGNDVFMNIRNGNGSFVTAYKSGNFGTGVIDAGSVINPAAWASVPDANKENLEVRFYSDAGTVGSVDVSVGLPLTVTPGANDQFMISVEGKSPALVTLAAGSYTTTSGLAAAAQTAVNTALGASPPSAGAATVAVDGSGHLLVSPNGGASTISLTAAGANSGFTTLFGTPTQSVGNTYYDLVMVDATTPANTVSLLTGAAPAIPTFPGVPAGLRPYHAGQPISFSGLSTAPPMPTDFGVSVTVNGAPANGDVFSVTPSTQQSVFRTLANLIGTLENANSNSPASLAQLSNEVGFALTNLDQANENFLRVRANIGSRLSEIDSLGSVNEDLTVQYKQSLSDIQDLDYAKTYSDLTRKQMDLEAAQKSYVSVSKLSLFNYI